MKIKSQQVKENHGVLGSRSRAARLARTIQDDINLDEQRNLVMHLVKRIGTKPPPKI